MNRRKAREGAFIILFQFKFQPEDVQELLDYYFQEFDAGNQTDYINRVVLGTVEHLEEIDQMIETYAKGWTVGRISAVSLAVMRLAIYEMLYCEDIPNTVAVSEGVSLAKEYEGEEAAPFVNGILGNIKEVS